MPMTLEKRHQLYSGLHVNVSHKQKEFINKLAQREGVNSSLMVRRMINFFMEFHKDEFIEQYIHLYPSDGAIKGND